MVLAAKAVVFGLVALVVSEVIAFSASSSARRS